MFKQKKAVSAKLEKRLEMLLIYRKEMKLILLR